MPDVRYGKNMIGEMIAEVLLEGLLYAASYWTGSIFITLISGGKVNIAPFDRKRKKTLNPEWDFIITYKGKKALTAESVCLVGFLVWVVIGVGLFFLLK
jgi:hypothetical protein